MYFLQKLRITPHKPVDPLNVWKDRVPKFRIQTPSPSVVFNRKMVSPSVQDGMQGRMYPN